MAMVNSGLATLPPTIALSKGWNLVGVIGPTMLEPGTSISADTYLVNLSWSQAMGYDTSAGIFTTLLPNTGADLIVGQGYYVYFEKSGVLVP
jgi:hypothetical protein